MQLKPKKAEAVTDPQRGEGGDRPPQTGAKKINPPPKKKKQRDLKTHTFANPLLHARMC